MGSIEGSRSWSTRVATSSWRGCSTVVVELDDDAFLAEWDSGAPRAHTLLCPQAPGALLAFTVRVNRPIALTRTYLLLVSKQARILSFLCQRGATIWLVPHAVALREWAKEGAGTGYDLYSRALPVGLVTALPAGLDAALGHVGFSGP